MVDPTTHQCQVRAEHVGAVPAPPQGFGQSMLRALAPVEPHAPMPNPSHVQPHSLGLGPSVVQVPVQGEYPSFEGPPPPYVADAEVGAHAVGQPPSTEAAVNALHVQEYGGNTWNAPRATGTGATPTVLANGLAKAQMARVTANIPMPKYNGHPEELDEFERMCNKCVNDSNIGCSDA